MNDPKDWTDKEFLDYVEIHSQTPRALFSCEHVKRFAKLSKCTLMINFPERFYRMLYVDIKERLADAYKNLEKSNETLL
jgi:hypothetical protein